MTTLLITGGAGFIGSNLVRHVMEQTSARVVVVDKLTYAGSLSNLDGLMGDRRLRFVKADIGDESMRTLFEEEQPGAVINLAAETHVDRSIDDPRAFVHTNVVGTSNLLKVARDFSETLSAERRRAFRFLHVSTDEVFGTLGNEGRFSEDTRYAPNSPYAASKAAADHLVRAYYHTYGLPVLITNCSNNFGPRQFPEKLIPLVILNALDGLPIPIYGDGGNVRDWLHVEDHCRALLRVVERGGIGESYNIGGSAERTNIEVVERIIESVESLTPAASNRRLIERGVNSYRSLMQFVTDRPGHDRRYAIDSSKIERELQWTPLNGFEDGLASTVRWYVEHRDWCRVVLEGKYERQRLGLMTSMAAVRT